MAAVFRSIISIVAGLLLAFILVIGVEFFSSIVHPIPADFNGTMEEMCAHVARYPPWVLAVAVPLWGATGFAGTWLTGRIGNRACALFVGLLLLTALVSNLAMLPYPVWFKIACLTVIPCAILAGLYLSKRSGQPQPLQS